MWPLKEPARQLLKAKYGFNLTEAWLEQAMTGSVRFNTGGAGGFVSADGLIVTNHHIGAEFLQKLSPKGKDYLRGGFYARTRNRELKCPDLQLNVLMSIDDVTDRVNGAVRPDLKPDAPRAALRAGPPGTPPRRDTRPCVRSRRDVSHPYTLYQLRTLEALLRQFAELGPEPARRAATDLHRVANARKAFSGQYQGLLDPSVLARKAGEEKALRDRFKKSAEKDAADPWEQIEEAQRKLATFE